MRNDNPTSSISLKHVLFLLTGITMGAIGYHFIQEKLAESHHNSQKSVDTQSPEKTIKPLEIEEKRKQDYLKILSGYYPLDGVKQFIIQLSNIFISAKNESLTEAEVKLKEMLADIEVAVALSEKEKNKNFNSSQLIKPANLEFHLATPDQQKKKNDLPNFTALYNATFDVILAGETAETRVSKTIKQFFYSTKLQNQVAYIISEANQSTVNANNISNMLSMTKKQVHDVAIRWMRGKNKNINKEGLVGTLYTLLPENRFIAMVSIALYLQENNLNKNLMSQINPLLETIFTYSEANGVQTWLKTNAPICPQDLKSILQCFITLPTGFDCTFEDFQTKFPKLSKSAENITEDNRLEYIYYDAVKSLFNITDAGNLFAQNKAMIKIFKDKNRNASDTSASIVDASNISNLNMTKN